MVSGLKLYTTPNLQLLVQQLGIFGVCITRCISVRLEYEILHVWNHRYGTDLKLLLYVKMKFMFVHQALGTNYHSSSPTRAPKQTIAQDSRTPFPTARSTCSFKDRESLWDNMINSATGLFTTQEGYDMVSQLYVASFLRLSNTFHPLPNSTGGAMRT